jgi:hypothetical protein
MRRFRLPNPWFRLYSEIVNDAKVQMLSEAMRWRWIAILCLRCEETLETLQERQIAFRLRVTETELAETKAIFIENGFIDERWSIENWNRRQFISDSSTDRVRRFRAVRAATSIDLKQNETLHGTDGNVTVTSPEQNRTDTDSKQKQKKPAASGFVLPDWVDSEAWKNYDEMRRKMQSKWPWLDTTRKLAIKELERLRTSGNDPAEVLNQAALKGWRGLFAVNNGGNNGANHGSGFNETRAERNVREALALMDAEQAKATGGDDRGAASFG